MRVGVAAIADLVRELREIFCARSVLRGMAERRCMRKRVTVVLKGFFSIVEIVFLENIADGREGCQTIVGRINFFFLYFCVC